MKKLILGAMAVLGIFAVIIIAAGLILPGIVNVTAYKTRVEELIAQKTGCSFSVGDDVKITVFPWLGLRLSELHLHNPKGFESRDMVYAKNFEARVKLLPLFLRKVEIGAFVLDSPRIFLERSGSGRGNWEAGKEPQKDPGKGTKEEQESFSISSLTVDTFSITNGEIQILDKQAGITKKLTQINLSLSDISLHEPVRLDFEARFEDMPISVGGIIGPLGNPLASQDMDVDLKIQAMDMVDCHVTGHVTDPSGTVRFQGKMDLSSFSPREFVSCLKMKLPVQTADPSVLEKFALAGEFDCTPDSFSLSNTLVELDDTTIQLDASVRDFALPNITAKIHVNEMDVDRYLPSAPKRSESTDSPSKEALTDASIPRDSADLSFLSEFIMDIQADTGKVKIANLTMDKTKLVLTGKKGIYDISPLELGLYQGMANLRAQADVTGSPVQISIQMDASQIRIKDLLRDAAGLNFLEGLLETHISLTGLGTDSEAILATAKGRGDLVVADGAIVGIDLAALARNTASILKGEQVSGPKLRTDFSELSFPFSISRGIAVIEDASLRSPFIRTQARGTANFVDQVLDVRVEPKFVGTIKGQGDTQEHSGVLVPLKITGSFSEPKIRPDMTKTLQKVISDPNQLKRDTRSLEKKARGLLKELL